MWRELVENGLARGIGVPRQGAMDKSFREHYCIPRNRWNPSYALWNSLVDLVPAGG